MWKCANPPDLAPIAATLNVALTEPLFGGLPARMLQGGPPQVGFTVEHAAARIAICRACEHRHATRGCDGQVYPVAAVQRDCDALRRWSGALLGLGGLAPCDLWKDPAAEAYRAAMKGPP